MPPAPSGRSAGRGLEAFRTAAPRSNGAPRRDSVWGLWDFGLWSVCVPPSGTGAAPPRPRPFPRPRRPPRPSFFPDAPSPSSAQACSGWSHPSNRRPKEPTAAPPVYPPRGKNYQERNFRLSGPASLQTVHTQTLYCFGWQTEVGPKADSNKWSSGKNLYGSKPH